MSRKIIVVGIAFLLLACETGHLKEQVSQLQKENDSLRKIAEWVKEKYVFDSVAIKSVKDYNNTFKIGSVYKEELCFVGYNTENKSLIIIGDSVAKKNKSLHIVSGDSLKNKGGTYFYSKVLDKRMYRYYVYSRLKNTYGKEYVNLTREGVFAYEKEVSGY